MPPVLKPTAPTADGDLRQESRCSATSRTEELTPHSKLGRIGRLNFVQEKCTSIFHKKKIPPRANSIRHKRIHSEGESFDHIE